MKIWFDMTNSPHVMTFMPFIKLCKKFGYEVKITARKLGQTTQMLDDLGITYEEIGEYGGKTLFGKIINVIKRTYSLMKYAKNKKVDVCFTKAPSSLLASWMLGIPVILFSDNEYSKVNYLRPLATLVVCPKCLPFKGKNVLKYEGIEEGLYLLTFRPKKDVMRYFKKGVKNIVIRTAPSSAHYLKIRYDPIIKLIKLLRNEQDINMIIIKRDYGKIPK
ncbi:MAG: DUF354 domain-containing protein, partial [Candidatus Diapherotrites archaeon]|nr:DUF354 domain-containing protein [Candidatus Diapherotrites archaeon]